MPNEDWLDTTPALLPVPAELPADPHARLQLATECWSRLSEPQKRWLTVYRDCGLNARKAQRQVTGRNETNSLHTKWMHERDYGTLVRLWRGQVADDALNRDRLIARQDDIVETLLTPKPILHQGVPVLDTRPGARPGAVLEEVEAGAASRANEVLMKAAGLLKDKDVEVNVGLVGPTLQIQVVQPNGEVREVAPRGVKVELPAIDVEATPVVDDEDWLK